MKYQKIIKKLQEVGFDEFYQAGSTSKFHPMNIIAKSEITNKQYWICVDGGYRCPNNFHIAYRDLNNVRGNTTIIKCKNQTEIVEQLNIIKKEITLLRTA